MKPLKVLFIILAASFLAISCGGGGDGNGSSSSSEETVNEFVSLITTNVPGCTSQSLSASVKAINISSVLATSKDMFDHSRSLPVPSKSFAQAIGFQDFSSSLCTNGNFTFTPVIDTSTTLTGVFNANQCSSGSGDSAFTIDGSLNVSAEGTNFDTIDISNPDLSLVEITSLSLTSSGINLQAGSEDVTIVINMSATGSSSSLSVTITNLSVTDNNFNETFSLTNATIGISGLDSNDVMINASGTYSDPELGTFTFSTPSGLTIDILSGTVTGSVQINGSGISEILVTINDNDDIIIQTDGITETVNCSGFDISSLGF